MADPLVWADLISSLRQKQNLSQRQLAAATGINRSTLRRIERDGIAEIDVIENVLEFLGYELDAFPIHSDSAILHHRLAEETTETGRSKIAATGILELQL